MKNAMKTPRRLVGIDGSGPSDAALRWAARRSGEDGRPLVLAHVSPSDATESTVLDNAAALVHEEHPGVRHTAMRLSGQVWQGLTHAAGPQDTVIIGTHKTGLLRGRTAGALSIQVAIAARSAVAIIPDLDLNFRRGVVVGVGSPRTAAAVAAGAYREVRHHTTPVTLVHGGCAERCAEPLDAAEQWLSDRDPSLRVRRRALSTPAANALLDAALDKELLVLGRGVRSASGAPIGIVTHSVLMNATSPVLLLAPV